MDLSCDHKDGQEAGVEGRKEDKGTQLGVAEFGQDVCSICPGNYLRLLAYQQSQVEQGHLIQQQQSIIFSMAQNLRTNRCSEKDTQTMPADFIVNPISFQCFEKNAEIDLLRKSIERLESQNNFLLTTVGTITQSVTKENLQQAAAIANSDPLTNIEIRNSDKQILIHLATVDGRPHDIPKDQIDDQFEKKDRPLELQSEDTEMRGSEGLPEELDGESTLDNTTCTRSVDDDTRSVDSEALVIDDEGSHDASGEASDPGQASNREENSEDIVPDGMTQISGEYFLSTQKYDDILASVSYQPEKHGVKFVKALVAELMKHDLKDYQWWSGVAFPRKKTKQAVHTFFEPDLVMACVDFVAAKPEFQMSRKGQQLSGKAFRSALREGVSGIPAEARRMEQSAHHRKGRLRPSAKRERGTKPLEASSDESGDHDSDEFSEDDESEFEVTPQEVQTQRPIRRTTREKKPRVL